MPEGITNVYYRLLRDEDKAFYTWKLAYRYHNSKHTWTWHFRTEEEMLKHWEVMSYVADLVHKGKGDE